MKKSYSPEAIECASFQDVQPQLAGRCVAAA